MKKTHCLRGHERKPDNVTSAGACRECQPAYRKAQYTANLEKWRGNHLALYYKMTTGDFAMMLDRQGGLCVCCQPFGTEKDNRPVVDHDHACCPAKQSCGLCVRGLLCRRCNRVLGEYENRGDIHLLPEYLKGYLATYRDRHASSQMKIQS